MNRPLVVLAWVTMGVAYCVGLARPRRPKIFWPLFFASWVIFVLGITV